jgi:hypothetical protein
MMRITAQNGPALLRARAIKNGMDKANIAAYAKP